MTGEETSVKKDDFKHIIVVARPDLTCTVAAGGCGECQSSCQSACKTSCTVGNQACEK